MSIQVTVGNTTYTGINLIPIGNGANWYIDSDWAPAPTSNVSIDTSAANMYNGCPVWKVTLNTTNSSVDYGGVTVKPGDQIVMVTAIKTSAATVTADISNPQAGGRPGIDVYGAKGRICGIQTPNGVAGYSSDADNTYVQFGTSTYKLSTIVFTVASDYTTDGELAYTAGQQVAPSSIIPWLQVWSDTNSSTETGTAWFYPLLFINPTVSTASAPTAPTPTPATPVTYTAAQYNALQTQVITLTASNATLQTAVSAAITTLESVVSSLQAA